MFEFIKNLFKKVNDESAKSLYNELSNEFIGYINLDTKNSKEFWDIVTPEELDIIRYEYIESKLLNQEYLKFFKDYQNPVYRLFLSSFNIYGRGSLIKICTESRNINYLLKNIEKFRSICTKYSNEDLEYNYWESVKNRKLFDSYDNQILDYLYLKFKYNEIKTNNVLEEG